MGDKNRTVHNSLKDAAQILKNEGLYGPTIDNLFNRFVRMKDAIRVANFFISCTRALKQEGLDEDSITCILFSISFQECPLQIIPRVIKAAPQIAAVLRVYKKQGQESLALSMVLSIVSRKDLLQRLPCLIKAAPQIAACGSALKKEGAGEGVDDDFSAQEIICYVISIISMKNLLQIISRLEKWAPQIASLSRAFKSAGLHDRVADILPGILSRKDWLPTTLYS